MVDHEDRSAADKFSVSRLRRSMRGTNAAVPSSVHGAPQVRGRGANRAPAQPAAAWLHALRAAATACVHVVGAAQHGAQLHSRVPVRRLIAEHMLPGCCLMSLCQLLQLLSHLHPSMCRRAGRRGEPRDAGPAEAHGRV